MISLRCWDVDCQVDGIQKVWYDWVNDTPPTECPIDVGHTVNNVAPTPETIQAHDVLNLNDGAGRVFQITIDQNGTLSTVQVAGDPPA